MWRTLPFVISWDWELVGRVRVEAGPSPLGEITIQSLPPFITSFHLYVYDILYNHWRLSRSFCIDNQHLCSYPGRIRQAPSLHPRVYFPRVSSCGTTHQNPRYVPLGSFLYMDSSSPIARKTSPSQLILKPSAMLSAFSTVGSALGRLHGISGILIHIWRSARQVLRV